jgi:hypothetical protein
MFPFGHPQSDGEGTRIMATLTRIRPITVGEYLAGETVSDIRHEFAGGDVRDL